MRWTVLVDNRTNDSRLETEHGLSILLDTDRHRILLDTGASDVFIRNATRLGIDLSGVDYVFISHGHSDHAGGLKHLAEVNDKARIIVAEEAVHGRFFSNRGQLHSITAEWPQEIHDRLLFADDCSRICDDIHIMTHIPQIRPIPEGNRYLLAENGDGDYVADDFGHETALYTDGLLFTGCAHSGLENILAACHYPVKTVVGGFHLLDDHETEQELSDLAHRLTEGYPDTHFYTSHCTGDKVFATLNKIMGDRIDAFSCGMTVMIRG